MVIFLGDAGNSRNRSIFSHTEGRIRAVSRDTEQTAGGAEPQDDMAEHPQALQRAGEPVAAAGDPLGALQVVCDQLRDQLTRTAADFENYRRRSRKEVEEARIRGRDDVVRDLLPVFDNLERAVAATDQAADVQSVVEGVRMVLKLFEDTAQRMGMVRVAGVGERFDPNIHEAIQQVETDEQPPGTIIAEVAPGYRVGERLLRPGTVVVARPRKPVETPGQSG